VKRKGCLMGFLVLAVVVGYVVTVKSIQNRLHPVYHGKHLVKWADEAVWAEDRADRQRAVEILREGCDREDEEARLRVYEELAIARKNGECKEQLPEELIPFLLEAFKQEDQCAGMVTGGLEKCPASQTAPQLAVLLKDETNPIKRYYLIRTLGRFGTAARAANPLLQHFLGDENRQVREAARRTLDVILHPAEQVQRGRNDNRLAIHEAAYRLAQERLANQHLLVAALGGIVEKQADQAGPDAAEPIAREELHHAPSDEQPGERLPRPRSPVGCSPQVAGRSPQNRAEYPAAVEREGRDQIERQHQQVDKG
jgi:hypothetical protein